jgi:type VI secretion system secreted protein VgrG
VVELGVGPALGYRVYVRDGHGKLAVASGIHLQRLEVDEAIGYLTRAKADVACLRDFDADDLAPGNSLSFSLDVDGVAVRWFHFLVREVTAARLRSEEDRALDVRRFHLELATRMEKLALVSSHAVFVDQTLAEIVQAKLELFGFEAMKADGTGDYEFQFDTVGRSDGRRRRGLAIQYGESDMDFIARHAEHAGISVFVEHDANGDRTVATDIAERFRLCLGAETVELAAGGDRRGVFEFTESRALAPNAYVVRGYSHREPLHEARGTHELSGDDFAGGVYEFGGSEDADHSAYLARVRAEERSCRQQVFAGKSTYPQFLAGGRSVLVEADGSPPVAKLLFFEVRHRATFPTPWDQGAPASYENAFRACSGERMFRPGRLSALPRLPQLLTGTIAPVVPGNPSTDAAEVDAAGCYRVRFHFDADTGDVEQPSCPVRMAQPYAGGREGLHLPLRVGTEVLVAFVGGDPDRPVIVGALPNAITPSVVTGANAANQRFVSPFGSLFEFGKVRS